MYNLPGGWVQLTSTLFRGSPVYIRASEISVVGDVYRTNAKPEDNPEYTEVFVRGLDSPCCVVETKEEVMQKVGEIS